MSIASDLTALCSAQSTLINDVLAQSVLADVPAASMATLGSFASDSTQKTVQFGAGGDAILTVPVQDGLKFKVSVGGHTHNPSGSGVGINVLLYLGSSQTAFTIDQSASPSAADQPFAIEAECLWDSTSNKMILFGTTVATVAGSGPSVANKTDFASISSPSNFQFKINGYVDGSNSSATLTITEFRAYAA